MFKQLKSSNQQGDMGIGIAIGWFTVQGFKVFIPITPFSQYDLIVDMDGYLKRIQVKTTYYKSKDGIYVINLKSGGGSISYDGVQKFDNESCDYIFAITNDGIKYLIPRFSIKSKTTLNLGPAKEEYIVNHPHI